MAINTFRSLAKNVMLVDACVTLLGNWKDSTFTNIDVC